MIFWYISTPFPFLANASEELVSGKLKRERRNVGGMERAAWFSMQKGTVPVLFATGFRDLVCGRLIEAAVKIVTLHVTRFWSIVVSIYNNGPIC